MGQLIKVLDKEIMPVVYNGTPVLSLRQIDELHERPSGTARRTFNQHREELVEGEDFFELSPNEWAGLVERNSYDQKGGHKGNMIFFTEYGYPLLVKSFSDKKSWEIQRALRKVYFAARSAMVAPATVVKRSTIKVDEAEFWKMKADLAEMKLKYRTRVNWDEEEIAELIELHRQGITPTPIGEKMGRSHNSVSTKIRELRQDGKL